MRHSAPVRKVTMQPNQTDTETVQKTKGGGTVASSAVLDSIRATLCKRAINFEISRRALTMEGNTTEAMLLQTRIEELSQVERCIHEHLLSNSVIGSNPGASIEP